MENFPHDRHHLDAYEQFAQRYEVQDFEQLVRLYDVYELTAFLPPQPDAAQKVLFNELVGVQRESGYLDYARSTNTFELIMQWQERTGQFFQPMPLRNGTNQPD